MPRNSVRAALLCASICVSLTGCGQYVHWPESSELCETVNLGGWTVTMPDYWSRDLGDSSYHVIVDDSAKGVLPPKDPVPGDYWIRIEGHTSGKAVGYREPQMLYDPSEAILEVNGKEVRAFPHVWRQRWTAAGAGNSLEELTGPVNLNTPHETDQYELFMAFPRKRPAPADVYSVALGSIVLDGQRVALPTARSCHRASGGAWFSFHG